LPQTPLGELTGLPSPLARKEGGERRRGGGDEKGTRRRGREGRRGRLLLNLSLATPFGPDF